METDFNPLPINSLLSPSELAKIFGISKAGVYRLINKRALPFLKIGGSIRFRPNDVKTYMESCRVKSANEYYERT
ncbi:MAG: helix-turn-helix domain-containing protein [Candidatus Magasanikbacteria bacterium]|nr:helix-turn-helix domain-containing protein [Candidatus Magasanikbacteria bacterium]